ncbi:MAG: hypothetical protein ACODAQ_11555 [Phycisphaeraceae bacterium]
MADTMPVMLDDQVIEQLARELTGRAAALVDRRLLVGIAGVPGAGKSTLAQRLLTAVHEAGAAAALVPMDGFHLTSAELRARGLVERKGAMETFDAERYIATLKRFRAAGVAGPVPIYDRTRHEPVVPGDPAQHVQVETRLILTEGNYLLLNEPPWSVLAEVLDETWWLDTPVDRAQRWLMQRHRAGGRSEDEVRQRCGNDRRNAERVVQRSRAPDRVVCWRA